MQSPHGFVAPGRVGRPRNTRIDAAVLESTLAILDEDGYSQLSVEQVARRARTTKPAIYRRWPTRQHLVLAALARRVDEVPVPNTGCTLCDLGECVIVFIDAFERMPPGVLGPLLGDCAGRTELRAEFMRSLFDPPRAAVQETITRAIARGDLRANISLEMTVDLLASLVHYRALFGHAPTGHAEIECAVETLVQGIANDYQALVDHSRQQRGASGDHQRHAAVTTSPLGRR